MKHKHKELWPRIAELRAQGKTYAQISFVLDISYEMINYHRTKAAREGAEIPPIPPRSRRQTYLGKLCRQGHNHEGTGQSLRYSNSSHCVACAYENQERQKERYRENRAIGLR